MSEELTKGKGGIIGKNIGKQGLPVLNVGNPGNSGGGRPPNLIRAACRESFDKRIPILESIADDETASPRARIAAVHELSAIGLPTQQEVAGVDGESIKAEVKVFVHYDEVKIPQTDE